MRSFQRQLHFIIARHPGYAWGGSQDLEKGLDCSGYLYLAGRWAAIPGITRTTSGRMAQGLGGWISREISPDTVGPCDLIFWTLSSKRPAGHVGAFLRPPAGELQVTHASFSRGVVLEKPSDKLATSPSRLRRLTIGD
jgi:cell wall-associated NlpC family hydrolase